MRPYLHGGRTQHTTARFAGWPWVSLRARLYTAMARHLNLLLLALCVHSVQASMAAPQLSRRAVAVTAAAAAGRAPARAFAADKGKEYNDCMSKCMYEVPV